MVEETKDIAEAIQNSSISGSDNKDMAPFSQSEVLLENTIDPRIIWQKHGKPFVKSSPINEKLASTAVDSLLNVFTEFWSKKKQEKQTTVLSYLSMFSVHFVKLYLWSQSP